MNNSKNVTIGRSYQQQQTADLTTLHDEVVFVNEILSKFLLTID